MKGHYFDEEELWKRLELVVGFRKVTLPVEYSKFINHTNYERLINIDPALIDRDTLEKLRKENHPFTSKEFMKDEDVRGHYPNGIENQRMAQEIISKRIEVTNDKWGEGKVERITSL